MTSAFLRVSFPEKWGFKMIYTCHKCGFEFERVGEIKTCPDCGSDQIAQATEQEQNEYWQHKREFEEVRTKLRHI